MAIVVTSTIETCTELWYDPVELATAEEISDEQAEIAVADASWLLWALTGYRFHGYQCWSEDYRPLRGLCILDLAQWPVDTVFSVSTVDLCNDSLSATGVGTEVNGWCDLGGGRIEACSPTVRYGMGSVGCGDDYDTVLRVHYRTAPNLPPGFDRAALRLAREYVKALSGKPCALPERITSISRQGASWTILDPQDFLRDGLTGIGPIDQWISTVNGRGWVKLTDPLTRLPLVRSTLLGCGAGCEP